MNLAIFVSAVWLIFSLQNGAKQTQMPVTSYQSPKSFMWFDQQPAQDAIHKMVLLFKQWPKYLELKRKQQQTNAFLKVCFYLFKLSVIFQIFKMPTIYFQSLSWHLQITCYVQTKVQKIFSLQYQILTLHLEAGKSKRSTICLDKWLDCQGFC